jgi:hypothetical protein
MGRQPSPNAKLIISHDSATRLSVVGEWLSKYPPDAQILIIAPTREAGDDFVRKNAIAAGARFGLRRFTLNRMAASLAAPRLALTGIC